MTLIAQVTNVLTQYLDPTTLLVLLLTFLMALHLWNRPKLPPGPWRWPVIGSLLQLDTERLESEAVRLGKEYNSDIVSVKLGPMDCIFLNKLDIIKEAFVLNRFDGRPSSFFKTLLAKNRGIATCDGLLWQEQRRFALTVLRDFGMGKYSIEQKIDEELQHFIEEIESHKGHGFDISYLLYISISNVVSFMVFNRRFDYSDLDYRNIFKRIEENLDAIGPKSLLNYIPILRHLPGDLFNYKRTMRNSDAILNFLGGQIEQHRKTFDQSNIRDLVDSYIAEIDRQEKLPKDERETTFNYDQLMWLIGDIFVAGSETTATTLHWGLLFLLLHPNVQERIHQEIDANIPGDRCPTIGDKRHMKYVEAVILEILRYSCILPLALPHLNFVATTISGQNVPENSTVFGNLYAVHRSPEIWKNPDFFDPQNFLDDEGNLTNQDKLIAFSLGRRYCLGESLARMELFLYITTILQRYVIKPADGKSLPTMERNFGIVIKPTPFELVMEPRTITSS